MNKLNSLGYNQIENKKSDRNCPLFVHTDAAQAIGKIKVDINELQVDYLTIVGHKVITLVIIFNYIFI
jgi:selenocysteine lyase